MDPIEAEYDMNHPHVVSAIDDLPLWSAPFGIKLLDVVKLRRNIQALDIGSGLGFPAVELSQRLGRSCRVFGIDPWSEAVRRINHKLRTWKITNLQMIEGVAESLPFGDAQFDLIVSNNGTNNVDDEEKAFAEIGRVAKAGAQVVFTVNLPGTMAEFYDVYRRVLREATKHAEMEKLEAHIHEKRKPIEHTRRVLRRAGLEATHVHEDHFTWRYTDGSAMLNHSTIKLAFLAPWLAVLAPADAPGILEALEHELNSLASRAGELRLTVPWACFDCRKLAGGTPPTPRPPSRLAGGPFHDDR